MSWKNKNNLHKIEKGVEGLEKIGSVFEASQGHFPMGTPFSLYNWGVDKIIKKGAPKDVQSSAMFKRIMTARKLPWIALSFGLTAYGVSHLLKSRKDGDKKH